MHKLLNTLMVKNYEIHPYIYSQVSSTCLQISTSDCFCLLSISSDYCIGFKDIQKFDINWNNIVTKDQNH